MWNWQLDIGWVVCSGPFSGSSVRGVRPQVTSVCKPSTLLLAQPREQVVGQKCRDTKLGWAIWFGGERLLGIHRNIKTICPQMLNPQIMILRYEQFAIKTRKYAFIRCESPVIWPSCVTRINRLIGVSKKCRRISCALCEQRNIVKTSIEWRAIGNNTMIHLVHARVQTGAPRRTWCALAVMLGQSHTLFSEAIQIGRFDKWMASDRETIGTKLIQCDE